MLVIPQPPAIAQASPRVVSAGGPQPPSRPRPPSASSDTNYKIFQRPVSAPTRRFDIRRHHAFLQQLKISLQEAMEGTIPGTVTPKEVEQRIALLRNMIADTERMGIEARIANEIEHNKRYVSTEHKKMEQEQWIAKTCREREDRHDKNFAMQKEDTHLLHRHRHRILDRRIESCHASIAVALVEKQQKGMTAAQLREQRLAQLQEKRQSERQYLAETNHLRETHANDVLSKKEELQQQEYLKKVEEYEAHRQAVAERQRRVEEERDRSASARRTREHEICRRGRSARVSVVLSDGEARMEVLEKPYELRIEEATRAEANRLKRYNEEHRSRQEFARFRAVRADERHKRQFERLQRITDTRLAKGEEIQTECQKKAQAAEAASARRRRQYESSAKHIAEDVQRHLQRAHDIEAARIEKIQGAKFKKWSSHTDNAAEWLMEEYLAIAADAERRRREDQCLGDEAASGTSDPVAHNHAKDMVGSTTQSAGGGTKLLESPSHRSVRHHHPADELDDNTITHEINKPVRPNAGNGAAASATLSSTRRHDTITKALLPQ